MLIVLVVQGRVINLQEERARSGHCITICLLRRGVAKIFAPPLLLFLLERYTEQAVASPLRQQASAVLVSASRHLSRGTSAAGCLSFGPPETLHFINRRQCCYDRAQRSDPHAVLCALRWKSTN